MRTRTQRRLGHHALWPVIAALILFAFSSSPLMALNPERLITQYRQLNWNTQSGLVQSSAQAITQTRDGYLWVGTQEGVSRFDGMRFTDFSSRNTPSIRNNFVNCELGASDGSLWAGTTGGLIHYVDGSFRTFTSADGLPANRINALYETRDGVIWIATSLGVSRYARGEFRSFIAKANFPASEADSFAEDSSGALWIGAPNRLVRYANGVFSAFRFLHVSAELQPITSIAISPSGEMFLAMGEDGVGRFQNGQFVPLEPNPFPHRPATSVRFDRDGSLWALYYGGGVARIRGNQQSLYTTQNGLPNANVLTAFEDREGNLWIGSEEGGLTELQDLPIINWGAPEGLPSSVVWSVLQDHRGDFWIGAESSGLYRLHAGVLKPALADAGLAKATFLSLHEDPDGSMWAGTDNGIVINVADGRIRQRFSLPVAAQVRAINQDRDGSLWIGAFRQGLFHYIHGNFEKFTQDNGLFGNTVEAILIGADGTLWAGGLGGLSHRVNGKFQNFYADSELHGAEVWALYQDRDGSLWVGTAEGGLHRIRDGRITFFGPSVGLFDLSVESIVEDDFDNLWMSSSRGIYKVSRKELNQFAEGRLFRIHSRAFGNAQGMRNAEGNTGCTPNAWKAADGTLWFANMGGLAVINPAHVSSSIPLPSVILEQVLANGRQISTFNAAGLTLEPGRGDLRFSYTVPTFLNPARVHFQYRLQGYDSAWVDADARRTVDYTNLSPGKYSFEVRARTSAGRESSLNRAFNIRLRPHLWQRRYLIGLAGALFLALLVIGYRLRVRQIQERNRILEKKIDERTAALRAATAAAEAAAEAKGIFLANMSHEIRTPLNAVIAMTDLLLDRPSVAQEDRECVQTIRTSGAALLSIVNSVLDFSKIESGMLEIRHEPFDLLRCVDEAIEMVSPQAAAKGLPVYRSIPQNFPGTWLGDAVRLRQVLLNLLSNAIKFTDAGRVEISISVDPAETSSPSRRIHFAVRDTGIGIPAEQFHQLFVSFSQIDNTPTRKHGGTGLGLAICRQLVELMGGQISVESIPAKGTTFKFYIIAEVADMSRDLLAVNAALGAPLVEALMNGKPKASGEQSQLKILLVEDNTINQKVAVRLLQRLGYYPDVASNGREGLMAIQASPYDIVIMDVQMPEMDGLEATRAIRASLPLSLQPHIIGMTANAFESARQECLAAGMNDYVSKPFTLDDLAAALQRGQPRTAV